MHIRFRFTKLGKVRFTSQRDVARMWERALRRAQLPVAYTEGFSPRPRLSFGLALPTGCESEAEYLDVALDPGRPETDEIVVASLVHLLTPLLPEGITVRKAGILGPGHGSLQQEVTSCSWTVDVAGVTPVGLEAQVARFLEAQSVPLTRERKGRLVQDDVRPAVLALVVGQGPPADGRPGTGAAAVRLEAELATRPRGVRPVELVRGVAAASRPATGAPLGPGDSGRGRDTRTPVLDRASRTHQWIERDGIRAEPLDGDRSPGADRAGRATLERASLAVSKGNSMTDAAIGQPIGAPADPPPPPTAGDGAGNPAGETEPSDSGSPGTDGLKAAARGATAGGQGGESQNRRRRGSRGGRGRGRTAGSRDPVPVQPATDMAATDMAAAAEPTAAGPAEAKRPKIGDTRPGRPAPTGAGPN
ncbi:MAG: TIGR03936 family radical SAM-associated protein, partial [Acidimicrobiales bacterium]